MTQSDTSFPTLKLTGAEIKPALKSYAPVAINSDRGNISCRLYSSTAPTSCGILWLNSAVGGWISPAKNLYPRVGRLLTTMGMSSLQLRYRYPGNLHESALDALAGITFLQHQGCTSVAIVGHAFGGAVAIQAATAMPNVKCVVTLATQSMGAAAISALRNDCAVMLIHGTADRLLPPSCSESLFQLAHEPKHLSLYEQADHTLDSVCNEVYLAICDWLNKHLVRQRLAIDPKSVSV